VQSSRLRSKFSSSNLQQQQQRACTTVQQQQNLILVLEDWATKTIGLAKIGYDCGCICFASVNSSMKKGLTRSSDEYYTEIDRRIRAEFPHKFQSTKKSGGGSQVASAGNSASRSTKTGRRSVKLSHSQVAIAKKLGVPLEEYAKYVKD
jgi:hypothetical protein